MTQTNPEDEKLAFEISETLSVVPTFDDFNLKKDLLQGIRACNFEKPLAIQQRAILPIIQGRDVVAQAPAGAGKTATLSIAVLQSIDIAVCETQALVLSSTRQIATQIQSVVLALGQHMNVKCCACVGGTPIREGIKELENGQQIVSGTPGRVFDMINRRKLRTQSIKMVIFDEADKILDKGFDGQISKIRKSLPSAAQFVLFSTTLSQDILEMTTKFMTNPIRILTKHDMLIPSGIKQFFLEGPKKKSEEWRLETICGLYDSLPITQAIIFCNSRRKVDEVIKQMHGSNFSVSSVHGGMEQKDRDAAMAEFHNSTSRALITTGTWVRGAEFQQVSLVINYEFPANREDYTHRINCLGRSGREGQVINLVTQDQIEFLHDIEQFYSTQINEMLVNAAGTSLKTDRPQFNVQPKLGMPTAIVESSLQLYREKMFQADPGGDEELVDISEAPSLVPTFDGFNLKKELLQGMRACNFEKPLAIQQRAILPIIQGRDVVIQAPAGAGKTATLAISVLQSIDIAVCETQALVLSSTRQVATQIQAVVLALGQHMNVKYCACVGGTPIREGIRELENGQQIVSGTPGRVFDMIKRRKLRTQSIKMVIFDEADKIFDKGFNDQVSDIRQSLPSAIQVVVLSTTLTQNVVKVAEKIMTDPIRILTKRDMLIPEDWRLETICGLYDSFPITRAVIFCNSRRKVDQVLEKMRGLNFSVSSVHGGVEQKDRDAAMAEFHNGTLRALITTGTWIRGAEFQQVSLVINYEFPVNCEDYAHRINCLGRSGREGRAINLVTPDEVETLRDIEQFYSIQINEMSVNAIGD